MSSRYQRDLDTLISQYNKQQETIKTLNHHITFLANQIQRCQEVIEELYIATFPEKVKQMEAQYAEKEQGNASIINSAS
jgi:uncharacterized coiled-coil protein SlyX